MSAPTIKRSIAGQVRAIKRELQDHALRSASRAGALVFYNEMKIRVPVKTGTLRDSIYHWHDDEAAKRGAERYVVGPNKRKAPHWHLVEYGHWRVNTIVMINGKAVATKERLATPVWVPASPYIRPTYDATVGEAINAARGRLKVAVRESLRDAAKG